MAETTPSAKKAPSKITKHMMIGDIAMQYPELAQIFFKYGMHCVGCHVAMFETIEQGMMAHGMSTEDIDKLVKELNESISTGKNKR